jgi:hypothetical protein
LNDLEYVVQVDLLVLLGGMAIGMLAIVLPLVALEGIFAWRRRLWTAAQWRERDKEAVRRKLWVEAQRSRPRDEVAASIADREQERAGRP